MEASRKIEPWIPLSELLKKLQETPVDMNVTDIRQRAGTRVISCFGVKPTLALPALVNIGMLSILMEPKLTCWELTPGVVKMVADTDLHTYPTTAPKAISSPFLIESRRVEVPLFGNTRCLGGYQLDGRLYLIGLDYPDGAWVAPMKPDWTGGPVTGMDPQDPVLGDATEIENMGVQAMRFAVIFGALLDAEKTPIAQKSETPKNAKRGHKNPSGPSVEWITRRLYIDRKYQATYTNTASGAGQDGKIAVATPVRGHLRHQPYGPGRQERKWVWIEGYSARRWIAPTPTKIIVDKKRA